MLLTRVQVCDAMLGCRKHSCPRVCHKGPCPPCEKMSVRVCMCGRCVVNKALVIQLCRVANSTGFGLPGLRKSDHVLR